MPLMDLAEIVRLRFALCSRHVFLGRCNLIVNHCCKSAAMLVRRSPAVDIPPIVNPHISMMASATSEDPCSCNTRSPHSSDPYVCMLLVS